MNNDTDLKEWATGNSVGNCWSCNSWCDSLEVGICQTCVKEREDDSISWGELAELTHATQVERFGWCICEDPEQGQLAEDCPKREGESNE